MNFSVDLLKKTKINLSLESGLFRPTAIFLPSIPLRPPAAMDPGGLFLRSRFDAAASDTPSSSSLSRAFGNVRLGTPHCSQQGPSLGEAVCCSQQEVLFMSQDFFGCVGGSARRRRLWTSAGERVVTKAGRGGAYISLASLKPASSPPPSLSPPHVPLLPPSTPDYCTPKEQPVLIPARNDKVTA